MVPFYVYYSMFGFQRIGDLAWAAGDMQARGFLLGGTSGRTTLNGEGLQHEDGHSHVLAGTIPNCISYDPTFAHEVGVILHHGLVRMVEQQDNVYYYLTLLNENYAQPGLRAGTEAEIVKGMYLLQEGAKKAPRVNLLGSGTILRESMAARELLDADWGIAANVWSCPSFNQLARDGQAVERWNLLHPMERPRVPFVAQQLEKYGGPVIASTDYIKNYVEQIRAFLPKGRTYKVLGTDGFGRSDFRVKLREHFEIDRHYIVVAALKALAEEGSVPAAKVGDREVCDRRREDQPARRLRSRAHGSRGSEGSRHRRFQGRRGHRSARQAGRPDQGRAIARHRGKRQGLDGDPFECFGPGQGIAREVGRQDQRGVVAPTAGG
jgi:pyruvate dehydrogenase E1 component